MKVALCQLMPVPGMISDNVKKIIDTMEKVDADLYVFPEMFLTDYVFTDYGHLNTDDLDYNLHRILELTISTGKCVIFGGPSLKDGIYNSAYSISDRIDIYKKINLAQFGIFREKNTFSPGDTPVMIEYGGFVFGLLICYDLFFPELSKMYAMNGADALIYISASPVNSKSAFDTVLPARSVENTVYTIFVNNTGKHGDVEFFGGSRCVSPSGKTTALADSHESVPIADIEHDIIEYARLERPTLIDTRVWTSCEHE